MSENNAQSKTNEIPAGEHPADYLCGQNHDPGCFRFARKCYEAGALAERLAIARAAPPMTPDEQHAQRVSFAYGNAHASNPNITREMVEEAARIAEPRRAT